MCVLLPSDAHQPHQSACLISVPEIQKAQSTDTDGSSFCSTSVEEDLMKVSLFAVLLMFLSQRSRHLCREYSLQGQIASMDVACSTDLRPSESMCAPSDLYTIAEHVDEAYAVQHLLSDLDLLAWQE